MSLIRQIWLLLLGTLILAWAASVSVNVSSARDTLETQLRLKNSDNATALAMLMSLQKGEPALMEMTAAAQFDTGFYRRIRFVGAEGGAGFVREAQAAPLRAPAWFVGLLPIESAPGLAQVSDGWRAIGSIEVVSQAAYAHDELWRGSLRAAFALLLVGVLAGLFAALVVGRIRRPLDDTVNQAAALQRGEYRRVPEPSVPELRRVTRAMNAMVERLRVVFETQAQQVESLRRQASCDAATGLSNRSHFMAQLRAALQREDGHAAGGLVLLRVLHLAEANRQLGREATDRLIGGLAQTLQAYGERVAGAFVGRLNGSDFALVLPRGGLAAETAQALVELMRASLAAVAPNLAVAAGAVEMAHAAALADVMGAADLALARAETGAPFSAATAPAPGAAGAALAGVGERGWGQRLREALGHGRLRLAGFPVVDAQGRLIHLECPLRVQLEPGAPFEVAAHWLPLAIRSGLTSEIDARAVALALHEIERDGQPRGVNLSPASLADSGFAARLRELLQAMPQAARQVWLEVDESAAVDNFERLRELGRQVRPTGARFGLEHAGERLGRIERLFEAGLDYVKLDAAITLGIAADPQRIEFVRSLAAMLRSMALKVIAEGVADAADAQALRDLGLDGITGPWVGAAADAA